MVLPCPPTRKICIHVPTGSVPDPLRDFFSSTTWVPVAASDPVVFSIVETPLRATVSFALKTTELVRFQSASPPSQLAAGRSSAQRTNVSFQPPDISSALGGRWALSFMACNFLTHGSFPPSSDWRIPVIPRFPPSIPFPFSTRRSWLDAPDPDALRDLFHFFLTSLLALSPDVPLRFNSTTPLLLDPLSRVYRLCYCDFSARFLPLSEIRSPCRVLRICACHLLCGINGTPREPSSRFFTCTKELSHPRSFV